MATPIAVRGDVTLSQFLKIAHAVPTGGQAKLLIRAGQVRVNDAVETRPGRQLHPGDRVATSPEQEWVLQA